MGDQFLSLTGSGLRLLAQSADIGHGVRVIPTLAGGKTAEPIRGADRSLAEDDGVVRHEHVEAIPGLDPEIAARLTRHDDLVLGADLHAKHEAIILSKTAAVEPCVTRPRWASRLAAIRDVLDRRGSSAGCVHLRAFDSWSSP
jgi:hypothetical protein